jgi:hypothetical protein
MIGLYRLRKKSLLGRFGLSARTSSGKWCGLQSVCENPKLWGAIRGALQAMRHAFRGISEAMKRKPYLMA